MGIRRYAVVLLGGLALISHQACAETQSNKIPLAFVANAGNNNIQVIDLGSGQTLTKLYTGATPWRVVLSPDHKQLWAQHWYSEKTVVVDLVNAAIKGILPERGPGLFNAAGDQFMTFSWPGGQLRGYDPKTLALKAEIETELKHPFSTALAWGSNKLYVGQYDPITKTDRPLYDYLMAYPVNKKIASPDPAGEQPEGTAVTVGDSPISLHVDPTDEFIVTANTDGQDLTLVNRHHAQARITLFPGPRQIMFVPNSRHMVVLGWREGAQESDISVLDVDWKKRPWPEVKPVVARQFSGGLVAGQMAADGKSFYALDRSHGRLIVFDTGSLEQIREIKVGDTPYDVVVAQVSKQQRDRWSQKRDSMKRLEDILAKVQAQGETYSDIRFTETMTATSQKTSAQGGGEGAVPNKKIIHSQFRAPDSLRQEFEPKGTRLAQAGTAVTLAAEGRFFAQPRQDLISAVYGIHALPVEEVIRQLAGDVAGSPFLRNGIAVDVVSEVIEDKHKYYVIGAKKSGDEVSQLWIRAEDWTPVDLVEKIPVFETRTPHGDSNAKRVVETKFIYSKVQGKYQVPTKMVRVVDGKEVGDVVLSDIQINTHPDPGLFDLSRLGGVKRNLLRKELVKPEPVKGGPGLAVPGQGNEHIADILTAHAAYNSEPPTSGPHVPYKVSWGVHSTPIPPELQVRHLEEGGVLLQYNCPEACPDLVQKLTELSRQYAPVLVAPYPNMTGKLALTAWERMDTLQEFDEQRVKTFIEAYLGKPHFPAESPEASDAGPGAGSAH